MIAPLSSGSKYLVSSRGGIYDPAYLETRVYRNQSTSSLFLVTIYPVKFVISFSSNSFLAPIPKRKPPDFFTYQPLWSIYGSH